MDELSDPQYSPFQVKNNYSLVAAVSLASGVSAVSLFTLLALFFSPSAFGAAVRLARGAEAAPPRLRLLLSASRAGLTSPAPALPLPATFSSFESRTVTWQK